MFMAGLSLFALASLFGGMADSAAWLLSARVAQGVGAAMAAPSALALVTTNFEEGPQRNRALAAVAGSYAASLALGLIGGGMLTTWASWRWVMFINVPIAVAVLVLAPLFINEAERHRSRFDLPGTVLSVGMMTALVYGFLHAASDGWKNAASIGTLAAGVVLAAVFVAVERRVEHPVTPMHLFSVRDRAAAYGNLLLFTAPMAGMFFFVTQILQNFLNYSPLSAGVAFLPQAAGLMMAGGMAAQLLPRTGAKPLILAGALFICGGMIWLSRVSLSTTYVGGVIGPMLLFGIGAGIAFTALNAIVLAGISDRDSGAASGLLETMQWLGYSLGLSVLVTAYGTGSRNAIGHLPSLDPASASHYVLLHGASWAFVGAAAFVAVAFVLTLAVVRSGKPAADAPSDGPGGSDGSGDGVLPTVDTGIGA
jgi:hypothetical protein